MAGEHIIGGGQPTSKRRLNINVDINACETVVCTQCSEKEFITILTIKKISALQSPTGQETIVPIPIIQCLQCGFPLQSQSRKKKQQGKEGETGENKE